MSDSSDSSSDPTFDILPVPYTGPYTPPPPSPSSISYSQAHTTLNCFGHSLHEACRAVFPNTNRSRYTKVSVLLLSWEDEDPLLPVSIEIERLEHVFGELYGYETEVWSIPDVRSHASLNRKVLDFVDDDEEESGRLCIVYYAGHARLTRDRLLSWTSWRNDKTARCPTVQWSGIQNVLEQSSHDVLILLDCCHSGVASTSEGPGVTELIAACAYNAQANGVGYYSFTKELIVELETLSSKPIFSVAELYRNIFCRIQGRRPEDGRDRHPAPVHICLTQDENMVRAIQLSPLRRKLNQISEFPAEASRSDEDLATSKPSYLPPAPQILLAIRLKEDFRADELRPELFKEWLRNMPTVAEEVRVEAGFGSYSSIVLVSVPLAIYAYLPQDEAIVNLGPITTRNILQQGPDKQIERFNLLSRIHASSLLIGLTPIIIDMIFEQRFRLATKLWTLLLLICFVASGILVQMAASRRPTGQSFAFGLLTGAKRALPGDLETLQQRPSSFLSPESLKVPLVGLAAAELLLLLVRRAPFIF